MVKVPIGWTVETEPPALIVLDSEWKERHRLRLISFSGNQQVSAVGTAEVEIFLDDPELSSMLEPWRSTVLLMVENEPVWGGVITKRRTGFGEAQTTLSLHEWTHWLDKVWSNEDLEYFYNTPPDGGWLIRQRMAQAVRSTEDPTEKGLVRPGELVPPLARGDWSGDAGLTVELDFPEQTYESSPQTLLDEINTVSQLGIDWYISWRQLPDYSYVPDLHTSVFDGDAEPAHQFIVGEDVASGKYAIEGEDQANLVRVIGAYTEEAVSQAAPNGNYPPLWAVKSFDKLAQDAIDPATVVQGVSDSLLRQLALPIMAVTDLEINGVHSDAKVGQLVEIRLESGLDKRAPNGLSAKARVQDISWSLTAQGRTTNLSLVAPYEVAPIGVENFAPTASAMALPSGPVPPQSAFKGNVISYVKKLNKRMSKVESRRGGSTRALYWEGSAGAGSWPSRSGVSVGHQAEWLSVLDPDAPPPPSALAGDQWTRAPGASF